MKLVQVHALPAVRPCGWVSGGGARRTFLRARPGCDARCTPARSTDEFGLNECVVTKQGQDDRFGLPHCYSMKACQGAPGQGLACEQVALTAESPYACEGFRLPTEAEWEYAARAGTDRSFAGGEPLYGQAGCVEQPALNDYAWYCYNSGARDSADRHWPVGLTHAVGLKKANGWGLHDTRSRSPSPLDRGDRERLSQVWSRWLAAMRLGSRGLSRTTGAPGSDGRLDLPPVVWQAPSGSSGRLTGSFREGRRCQRTT